MLDVMASREIQATILGLKRAERTLARDINKGVRGKIRPVWQGEVNSRARTSLERRVIASGARVAVGERGVSFYAATSRRPLSGGLVPAHEWAGTEFGARERQVTVTQRSRAGKRYRRDTVIQRQFRARQRDGMVAMDAASTAGRQLVAMWVRETVEQFKAIPTVEVTG